MKPEREANAPRGRGASTGTVPLPVEQLYTLLVNTVRDYAIFVLDTDGVVLTWNAGAERLNGYTADEIIGRHFSVFYPPADLAWDKPAMELDAAAADGRFEDEGWRVRRDGTLIWANVIITALRNEAGTLVGFAKVTRDLTERREAERRAIEDGKRIAEIETANRTKTEFLAAMSHELRTPLNAIGGYVDLLLLGLRGPLTEQQREDLERIRRSQVHLLGIINDLLNFSRIEAGRLRYELRDVPVCTLLDEVRAVIEPLAAARGIDVDWPTGRIDARVHADGSKTEQILINLLTNAVKYTSPGGRIGIEVAVARERDPIRIHVTDTGIGIPADMIEEIFEPFVQVGRSLSSAHEGTGLGLAISRQLARAMGGDLTVVSEPGAGSTFTLHLPPGRNGSLQSES